MENMTTVRVQKNQVIAREKEKVKRWYIIREGSVVQRNSYARVVLGKDAVIGISESDRYLCDYIAVQDTTLAVFHYDSAEDVRNIIQGQESMRSVLLRASLNQRQMLLKTYAAFSNLVRQFHSFVETQYNDYTMLCTKYQLEGQNFSRIDNFKPLEMVHRAEKWEINNSISLTGNYLEEYVRLMQKDDSMCIGAIMEASYQTRRVTQGIIEMADYLKYNRDILLSESERDIFSLYYDLLHQAKRNGCDVKPLTDAMDAIGDVIKKLNIYEEKLVTARMEAYHNMELEEETPEQAEVSGETGEVWNEEPEEEDCLVHILSYAGFAEQEIEEVRSHILAYQALPDMMSTDSEAFQLRKRLTMIFYDAYLKVFMRVIKQEDELTPILQMFLNFGFMDVQLADEENANALFELTEHLDVCNSDHIYTIYEWLKSVYEGRNEPSKNELDLDYTGYLNEMKKSGKIRAEQLPAYAANKEMKVKFEIQNMFTSGNRATYGKISTFCPILCGNDLINSVEKMLVTAQKVDDALDKIRKIDYSVFYRETMFVDPAHGINREMIMKEVLPNVILMPNGGTRAMMWQETAGVKRDTPARFLLPIFTAVDLDDMMIETVGRFRWEICRKIQGVHWNDIREKSLTAEYCDYIQFYRKNNDLSVDAKEKIKSALLRGRNNYREVFVKDYQNWIKYECMGSFRLNKVSRGILITYCPFAKKIRQELKGNPMYQNALQRMEIQTAKKVQRINGLYDKYQKAGGTITKELQDNLDYYDL